MAITAHPASQYQKRTFAQKLNEGVGRGLELGSQIMQEHKQEQELKQQKQQQEQNYNQENDTYRQLTGRNLSRDPKIREKEIEHALRGENEQKKIAAQLQGKSFGKEEDKKQQEIAGFEGALSTIDQMRNLRKQGNLGLFSRVPGMFGGETAKHRGEYQTLGNSLISYASNIPIRNRQEFEKLAGHIGDPNITDAEAEGILDGLERIINNSLSGYQQKGSPSENTKNQRTSLQDIFE